MSDNIQKESFSDILEKFSKMTQIKPKQIINATVLCLDHSKTNVFFHTYSKQENTVPLKEFDKTPEPGEVYPLMVKSIDSKGNISLSYRAAKKEIKKKELIEAMESHRIVEGFITGKNYNTPNTSGSYNGYKVNIEDVITFLPKTQIHGFDRIKDKETFDNTKYKFLITNIDNVRDTIHIVMLDDAIQKYNFENIEQAVIKDKNNLEAEVIAIEDYGCFILIDGKYLGFIKINDLSYNKRIEHPSEIVSLGEKIQIKILRTEANRFKCSLANIDNQTIEDIQTRFNIGQIYNAKISGITHNGCYVILDDGVNDGLKKKRIDGFIDSLEVSWNEMDFYNNKFSIGDKVQVKVLSTGFIVNCSIKQCNLSVFSDFCEQFKENSIVNISISGFVKDKAIGEIVLNNGKVISASIYKKELNWDFSTSISEFNKLKEKVGTQCEAKVISINKEGFQIDLSIKRLQKDPVDEIFMKYKTGEVVEAEVTHIDRNGKFFLLSLDKWKNILILTQRSIKDKDFKCKLHGKLKVKLGVIDINQKNNHRYIGVHLINNEPKNFNNSLADNLTWNN